MKRKSIICDICGEEISKGDAYCAHECKHIIEQLLERNNGELA